MIAVGGEAERDFGPDSNFGSEPQLPPVEPKGESVGVATGAADAAGRAGLAAGRGEDAGVEDGVAERAVPTLLNNSSIGSSRCA